MHEEARDSQGQEVPGSALDLDNVGVIAWSVAWKLLREGEAGNDVLP